MRKFLILYWLMLMTAKLVTAQDTDHKLSLDDIFKSNEFRTVSTTDIKSTKNGEHFARISNDSLNLYSYKSGKLIKTIITARDLINNDDSVQIPLRNFEFSDDETKIAIRTETERIYRHSSRSHYYIYNLEKSTLTSLSLNGKQQLGTFSPDGNKMAFVRDNNLFIKDLEHLSESQITEDGEQNKIINGAPDWVYEEEFGFAQGFQWSPDGNKIAYYRFDETQVKEFQMTLWGALYPQQQQFKYPKAGEDNSLVTIHIYDIITKETTDIHIQEDSDSYIPRIKWTKDPNTLSILWLNRLQNELKILLADATSGETKTIYHETNRYYVDITDNLTFLESGNNFIFTSEQDGYHHIYLFDMLGNLEQQITKGPWDVVQFLGINEKKGILYFISAESSPLNRELYSIELDGSNKKRLSEFEGTNNVQFSSRFNYYTNSYSNANTPPLITVHDSKGKLLRIIEKNDELIEKQREYGLSEKEFFSFETEDSIKLNGWLIKPPEFDSAVKYPVLMYVYGGPGSQTVRNSWGRGDLWYQLLAQNGVIVVSVDNRGTGSRGEAFKKMTYMQLGKYETIDQIEAAKYLGKLPFIDDTRIGIWGWSYGGYMAASCMTRGSEYFTMGMAVAPVTNWRYYDNIYTERFMRTPQENPTGYDDNSPVNHVDGLTGDLLIVHGTADDNVHLQNSVDLVTALVDANKQFDMQFYPNSNHGIYTGANTTYHLYSLLTNYVMTKLVKKAE